MCVKFPPGDLKPGPCPPHSTSTYTCGVTIAPRVYGGLCLILNVYIYMYECVKCYFFFNNLLIIYSFIIIIVFNFKCIYVFACVTC